MRAASVKPVRCAIYTRVSTEHGLDQEFNSLDAQYEAASAYIKSQAHAGWTLIRSRYDDGGYSGGSTDRPDLQKLLDDIRARKIDVIVVYKVDRLTRSLADFAKLVELFGAHGVSFVSVTQQFNTTTSMGRLTLNVLLSFAPPDAGFATKPKLATRMIARAIAASVPFKWVAGDTVYGVGDIEQQLRQAGKGYVLGVSSAHVFQSWGKRRSVAGKAADIARTRRSSDWKRLSAGAGTKGPRLHDWCYLELADLEVEEFNSANQGLWTRGLLIRRHIADGDLAFFTTWCPAGTSIETLVAVEGHRWAIEDSFETAKNEFGLDHNESRSWHGWHRHVSLVMLAFAMMAAIRHRANPPPPKKTKRRTTAKTKA
jgi:SRSO17 transposase